MVDHVSKNIIIEKTGDPQELTGAAKLSIPLLDGGESLWVPEDTRTRAEKSVTANGNYAASSDNAYAYSRVTVNVQLTFPYSGEASGGQSYNVYTGDNGRPYITINAAEE